MTDNLMTKRQVAFHQIENEIVGSNAAIIGNRSQLYDLSQNALSARSKFSFTIQHARIIDLATCAIYSPPYSELKNEKLRFWFSEEDISYANISEKFNQIFKKTCDLDFIDYNKNDGTILKKYENSSEILETCGNELKTWLNKPQPWMDRKIASIDGIVMLDCINQDTPIFDEIRPNDFGLTQSKYISLISMMQTFGIIRQTEDNRLIPYLSFEIYGDLITEGLDDMLENPFNRTIFEWCRKMPGISLNKIESLAFEKFPANEKGLVFKHLSNILNDMQKNGLIETCTNKSDNCLYIVPVWLRNSILKIHPSRIESDMVRNAILSCGILWQSIDDLSEYPAFLDNIKESLNVLGKGEDLTIKEILGMDARLKNLLLSFYDNGILGFDEKSGKFSIQNDTIHILNIIVDILRISGEADIWMEFVKGKPTYENMNADMEYASKEIHYSIADRYKATDLKKFREYK